MLPPTPRARWLLAALLALPLRGEDAPKPAAIGVTVRDVFDSRSSGQFTDCRVFLNLTGDAVADAHSIRRVHVTRAEDMLGRDLIKPDAPNPGFSEMVVPNPTPAEEQRRLDAVAAEVARRRELREQSATLGVPASTSTVPRVMPPASTATVPRAVSAVVPRPSRAPTQPVVVLRNPSRQSASIKIIEGEIELFTPTAANGGLVRVPNLAATSGTLLDHEALKKAGVRVMYLTPESYAAKREEPSAKRDDATGPWSDEFADQVKLLTRRVESGRTPVAIFFVDDPNQVLVTLEVKAEDGRPLERNPVSTSHPRLRAVYLDAPLPAGAQLVMRVAANEALKTYPFKLENIPLP